MKSFTLALLLSASSAFAFDICTFESTADFTDFAEQSGINNIVLSGPKFSPLFRKVIRNTMNVYQGQVFEDGQFYRNEEVAVREFLDWDSRENVPGSNGGDISLFTIEGKKIAMVHFYPGDNEYGSFYEIKANGTFNHLATIGDGEINCK